MKDKFFLPFYEVKQLMEEWKKISFDEKNELLYIFLLKKANEKDSIIKRKTRIKKEKYEYYENILNQINKTKNNKTFLYFSKEQVSYLTENKNYKKSIFFIFAIKISFLFSKYYEVKRERLIHHYFNWNLDNKNITRRILNILNDLKKERFIKNYKKQWKVFYFYKKY